MGGLELQQMKDIDLSDDDLKIAFYRYVHFRNGGLNEPRWRGIRIVKFPTDLILYSQVIQKRKPDFIIETGTRYGGSALFFADLLQLQGGKKCISIDITNPPPDIPPHPHLIFLKGSSIDPEIVGQVKRLVGDGSVMASLDSDHRTRHVIQELDIYGDIVTRGQYVCVEDCWTRHPAPYTPHQAAEDFLSRRRDYRRYNLEKQFIFAVTRDGWLRKIR